MFSNMAILVVEFSKVLPKNQYTQRKLLNFEFWIKAIETGMILSIMDMKKQLLCIFFIDLYSPR